MVDLTEVEEVVEELAEATMEEIVEDQAEAEV